ncbi:MAG: 3-alpha domain-containing protein, partial [Thermodesulfovibrionales bacterium]
CRTVSFACHTYHHDRKNCEAIEKVFAVPSLSASWQKLFQELKKNASKTKTREKALYYGHDNA